MNKLTRLQKCLAKFVGEGAIVEKIERLFELAEERRTCGFEKWLQFELALFFKGEGYDLDLERIAWSDRRRSREKFYFQNDLVIRLKNEETLAIELKVRRKAVNAVRALKKDLQKFKETAPKHKSTASFAVVMCGESTRVVDSYNEDRKYKTQEITDQACFVIGEIQPA